MVWEVQVEEKEPFGTKPWDQEEGEFSRKRNKCTLCLQPGVPGGQGRELLDHRGEFEETKRLFLFF